MILSCLICAAIHFWRKVCKRYDDFNVQVSISEAVANLIENQLLEENYVLCPTGGTLGDLQPFINLVKRIPTQKFIIGTSPEFKELIPEGTNFFPIVRTTSMVKNPFTKRSIPLSSDIKMQVARWVEDSSAVAKKCTHIIVTQSSLFVCLSVVS